MSSRKDDTRPSVATPAETGAMPTLDVDDDAPDAATEDFPLPALPATTRFVHEEEIGRGGMGVVVRAWDTELRRHVALKLVRGDLAASRSRLGRFVAEAQLTAQLDHPAIVPVHDLGVTAEGDLFYVMKHVKGHTLGELLRVRRRLGRDPDWPLRRILRGFLQACDGVAYAHSRGVIHRDLKPHNLIFGDFGEVFVLDWGVAALVEGAGQDEPVDAHPAGPSAMVGTQGYAAPEQLSGATVDQRTDVWALGAILQEILTGLPPGRPGPAPLTAPPELAVVCARATDPDPAKRFPSVRTFAAAIEAWQAAETEREADRIGWGRRTLELSALAMDARAVRIHDALSHLCELTRILFDSPAPDDDVDAWLRAEGFAVDPDGYFQPLSLPPAIREGRAPPDALSWCWPPSREKDAVARAHMYALRGIGPALQGLCARVQDLTFVYYADARNVALVFPADDMRAAVPSEFDFLSYPAFVVASPAENPAGGLRTTPPHVDYGNKGLITAMALPVHALGEFVGVWAADVPLSVLHSDLRLGANPGETTVIVDRTGLVVANSADSGPSAAEKGAIHSRRLADEGGVLATLDLPSMFERGHGELTVPDPRAGEVVVQYRVAPYLGWLICTLRRLHERPG